MIKGVRLFDAPPKFSGVLRADGSSNVITLISKAGGGLEAALKESSVPSVPLSGASLVPFITTAPPDNYQHDQTTPINTWTVNHNLGYKPAVQVFTVGGNEVLAEIVHVDVNQVKIYLDEPMMGTAICS